MSIPPRFALGIGGALVLALLVGAAATPQPLPLPPPSPEQPTAQPIAPPITQPIAPPVSQPAAPAPVSPPAPPPAIAPPSPSPAVAPPPATASASATEGELARLSRLAQEDAARRGADASVRNAPGRIDLEAGGMHRCVDASGASVFTDRRCDDIGAADAPPEVAPPRVAPGRLISVRSCARSKADLLEGVRSALEGHDVNRVAEYYDWAGMDGNAGYRLMDRLEAFARRPVVDVQLVSSVPARPVVDEAESPGLLSRPFDPPGMAEAPVAPAPRRRRADLLRVDQMRSDSDAASQVTYFRLRANAGCWWVAY